MGERIQCVARTDDGVIAAYECDFYAVSVDAAGAVVLYDNASAASGTVIWYGVGPQVLSLGGNFVHCKNGIYCDLTGNKVTVFYK